MPNLLQVANNHAACLDACGIAPSAMASILIMLINT